MKFYVAFLLLGWCASICAQTPASDSVADSLQSSRKGQAVSPPVRHPHLGKHYVSTDGALDIVLAGKKQNYAVNPPNTRDIHINSPKSVNIHPDGTKFYVNSLEGATTVVYDMRSSRKLKVIRHRFDESHSDLWAPSSPFYRFRHYSENLRTFTGKPVESTFSHDGRYLWVPYYRRSFDINAQDPSAIAVIDTRSDSIVRLMDAGVLPKMIATSPDGRYVAVTHWGDNTVGLIDIASADPRRWKHVALIAVDGQLHHNFSLTESVDRDTNSGNCLRGTVFTPDNRYLLVGCMGGVGGIAVIDVAQRRWLGKIHGMMGNLRHIAIANNMLYVSINKTGYVQAAPMADIYGAIRTLAGGRRSATVAGWRSCKVGAGARTLSLSPDGRYIYVACNTASALCIVDARTMKLIATVEADSYPVGLDVSADGRLVFTTSQGRNHNGGNCVDIYRITKLTYDRRNLAP